MREEPHPPAGKRGEPDSVLLDGMRRGDEEALRSFYDRYFDHLYGFVFYRVGNDHHDTEEIVQDTFLAVLDSLGYFDSRSSIFTWICGIAKHKIADLHRKRHRRTRLEVAFSEIDPALNEVLSSLEAEPLPDEILEAQEVREFVSATMASLPPRYKDALTRKYLDNQSVRQIAEGEGSTEKAVESILSRARRAFRKAFEILAGQSLASLPGGSA